MKFDNDNKDMNEERKAVDPKSVISTHNIIPNLRCVTAKDRKDFLKAHYPDKLEKAEKEIAAAKVKESNVVRVKKNKPDETGNPEDK